MAAFNEHSLEMSIMELFQDENYIYLNGGQIHRERSEVLLVDDLREYLLNRYAAEGLTENEVDSIILRLKSISGTIYEANQAVCKMICDGFIFNREDRTKKDLYIELINFDEPEKNIFKMPTIQSARSRQSAALYSASYSVDGLRWAKPSRIAFSSMLDSQRRENGFLHCACW